MVETTRQALDASSELIRSIQMTHMVGKNEMIAQIVSLQDAIRAELEEKERFRNSVIAQMEKKLQDPDMRVGHIPGLLAELHEEDYTLNKYDLMALKWSSEEDSLMCLKVLEMNGIIRPAKNDSGEYRIVHLF